jgi:lipoprotein-anchoring transpeptidase ErfK/SrfK
MQSGDRRMAHRWAEEAASLDPGLEEAWLILASVSNPRASISYLKQVLTINPGSQRARKGLHWARKRLQNDPLTTDASPQPRKLKNSSGDMPLNPPASPPKKGLVSAFSIIFLAFVCLFTVAWTTRPQLLPLAEALIDPPTLTPTNKAPIENVYIDLSFLTVSPSPTITWTPSPTFTDTPQPTDTPLPTLTPTLEPTQPPAPVQHKEVPDSDNQYIVVRGDTLSKIASTFGVSLQSLISVNNITNPSRISPGQRLIIPGGGYVPPVKPSQPEQSPVQPSTNSGKSIVVILSEQQMYAYEGEKQVFSFVVSTGRNNGTRPGTYRILDKHRNPFSYVGGFYMPYWMGIYWVNRNLENGFHSLPVLSNGKEIWGESLGTPVSYGCVVLAPGDAELLYNWTEIGTTVEIRR